MKYNVNINQKVLAEEPESYDLTDGALLDFFWYYCNAKSERIASKRIEKDGELYTWIDYGVISRENPLMNIKTKAGISKRVKRLEELGWIKTTRPENQKTYVSLSAKCDKLLTDVNGAVNSSLQSCKLPLTNHNTNNHNTNIIEPPQKNKYSKNDFRLAGLLDKKIKENYPILAEKNTNLDQWANDIRKLRQLDGANEKQIEIMIYWVHGGMVEIDSKDLSFKEHDFWSQNIQSAAKLREQFYKNLYPQLKKEFDKHQKKNTVADLS